MSDPLDKATSKAPATLGEGCLSRYDPEDMSPDDGTEFPGAAELWEQLQDQQDDAKKPAWHSSASSAAAGPASTRTPGHRPADRSST